MTTSIDRIHAKVARAKEHALAFDIALRAFHDTNPYGVGIREDAQAGKRTYYIARIDEVPLGVEAIAADATTNLRQTLDHIAYQLEFAGGGAKPNHRVYFPIANSAADYPAVRDRNVKFMRREAVEAIDAIEPYKGGKGNGLWVLNELHKVGDHHLLVAASVYSRSIDLAPSINQMFPDGLPDWAIGAEYVPAFYVPADRHPLKVGDDLYIEPIASEVNHQRQFRFDVAFDHAGIIEGLPAVDTLRDLTNLVDGLVTAFEPMFV